MLFLGVHIVNFYQTKGAKNMILGEILKYTVVSSTTYLFELFYL